MIADGFVAKIADFGESRLWYDEPEYSSAEEGSMALTVGVGTPMWMAPELLRCERYTGAVDASPRVLYY